MNLEASTTNAGVNAAFEAQQCVFDYNVAQGSATLATPSSGGAVYTARTSATLSASR